ncbi:hypothetical protein KW517_17510 [Vibrio fluvialis]|nr:hypothetical protein [Vibrio fluvialis]
MDFSKFKLAIRTLCLGLILGFFTTPVFAVHDEDVFELDGNAVDAAGTAGDDWSNIYNDTDSANVTTGIIADPSPKSIFTGGRKDIQDVPQWSHKDGSVPDKDDLTNAYAAAYGVDNGAGGEDLIIYFGADRFANVGDAFMGFWFFQDEVVAKSDGSFSGVHTVGDVLILVDYPQGANEVPYIAVVLWDPSCSKADSNDPMPGDCAASNLRLEMESDGAHPAECGTQAGDLACATTNGGDEASPWSYTPKAGSPNVFPYESFYEGGINITQLLNGTDTCFSSFMAETRSSSSFTASLKDFVLGKFSLCGMEIVKTCPTGALSPSGDSIIYDYEIKVTNTGFGSLYDINVEDVTAGDTFYTPSLAAGVTETYTGSFVSLVNGVENTATATAALKAGGDPILSKSDSDNCPPLNPPGSLTITKNCTTFVEQNGSGAYGLRVKFSGEVCNDSAVKLNGVAITETHDGMNQVINIGTLAPYACSPYSDDYVPVPGADVAGGPVLAHDVRTFKDTVIAEGVNAISGQTVDTGLPVEASCPLCPAPTN